MSIVDKFVFPKPKSKISLKIEENIIYLPVFKEENSYKILKDFLKNEKDFYMKNKSNEEIKNLQTSIANFEQKSHLNFPEKSQNTEINNVKELSRQLPHNLNSDQTLFNKKLKEFNPKMIEKMEALSSQDWKASNQTKNGLSQMETIFQQNKLANNEKNTENLSNRVKKSELVEINDAFGSFNRTFDFDFKRSVPSTSLFNEKNTKGIPKTNELKLQDDLNSASCSPLIVQSTLLSQNLNLEKTEFGSHLKVSSKLNLPILSKNGMNLAEQGLIGLEKSVTQHTFFNKDEKFYAYQNSLSKVDDSFPKKNFSALQTERSVLSSKIFNSSRFSLDYNILKAQLSHYVPILSFPHKTSSNLIIYFHSNAEDITMLETLCECLRDVLNSCIWVVEYPGYSIYSDKNSCAKNIKNDAKAIIEFLNNVIEIPFSNISIIGRSLGSGPAIYLSSIYKFGMVVIVSGFLSIKDVVKDKSDFLSRFVDSYFDNDKLVHLNKSPLLLIHGKMTQSLILPIRKDFMKKQHQRPKSLFSTTCRTITLILPIVC